MDAEKPWGNFLKVSTPTPETQVTNLEKCLIAANSTLLFLLLLLLLYLN